MNKKTSLFITTAAMLACFVNANATVTFINATTQEATPAQAEAQAPENAQAPAAEAPTTEATYSQAAAPAPEAAPEAPATAEAQPAVTPAPAAVAQAAATPAPAAVAQTAPAATTVAPAPAPIIAYSTNKPEELPKNQVKDIRTRDYPKRTVHYGINGEIGSTNYFGNSVDDMEDGLEWNAGLYASIPLSERVLVAEIGAKAIYRQVSNTSSEYYDRYSEKYIPRKDKITAYAIAIPFTLNIFIPRTELFFTVGTQLEKQVYNNLQISFNGEKKVDENLAGNQCAPVNWDFILGMGVNATKHFAITASLVMGISDIYDDLYVDDEYWGYTPFDINLGFRIFL